MAEREVRWTRTAQHDLNAIVGYIADDCTDNALAVLDRLQRRAETLSENAERGRMLPELRPVNIYSWTSISIAN